MKWAIINTSDYWGVDICDDCKGHVTVYDNVLMFAPKEQISLYENMRVGEVVSSYNAYDMEYYELDYDGVIIVRIE